MKTYNLDTSIWLDFYQKRGINGEYAIKFLRKVIEENLIIIYSDFHIRELKNLGYSFDEINSIFNVVKPNNIRKVHISREQLEESKKIASQKNIPKADVLFAILSRDNDAIMISRDLHFLKLKNIVETRKPEEII